MIGMRTIGCVKMLHIQDLPGWFTGLQEDVIQAVTEEHAAPGPVDLVRGGMPMFVDIAEGIQPGGTDVFDLMRMLGGVEVAGDDGRSPRRNFIHPTV